LAGQVVDRGASESDERLFDPAAQDLQHVVDAGLSVGGHPPEVGASDQDCPGAVGDRSEILLDGGIRRGSDVVKALALGARAVLIGRAYLWGMAANGETGVHNVLEILRSGIDETLLGLGHASIHDLTPQDLIVPPDFPLLGSVRAYEPQE
jgi:hypothetical protein